MADDDKGANPSDTPPVDHRDERPLTEWTASDRRGPLDAAGHEEVERVVPAHETDAEGVCDPSTQGPEVHDAVGETGLASGETTGHVVQEHGSHHADAEPVVDDGDVHVDASRPQDVHDEPIAALPQASSTAALGESTAHEQKRSLVPVAAGLIIGALIGAGSAWLVYSQSGNGSDEQQHIAALSSRVDALDRRPDPQPDVAKLQSGLAEVQGKVASLEKQVTGSSKMTAAATPTAKPQAQAASAQSRAADSQKQQGASSGSAAKPADAGLDGKISALEAALGELKTRTAALQAQDTKEAGAADKIKTLQGNLSDAQKQVVDAQKQAAGAQKQAESAQSALASVKSDQKQIDDKLAGLTIAVAGALKKADGAEKQAEGAQTGLDTVQTRQKALEGKLGSPALAVVADSLVQQVDAGQPYTRQVDALAALNADPAKISVLRENAAHGVPSAQALLTQWKPLSDPVIATGNKAPANANLGQRLEHGLFGLVSVRRADTTAGNDLVSRVNLIESDLAHDDVPGAYAVWQALPADAKSKSDSWGAQAKTSVEALAAARDLQHSAIDALGAKKS